ncbi:hypothetical protein DMB65_18850 [Flavobacterium cheongpyeongense]|jgi:hypothetical protein|uniref:IPT/TIG domain-containing protein n=1 Tax=Flavobacterium cheongpyeongense TaxID=2212651 RepID=A0A2V4BKZ9_9FLAO|nr:LamG-like jellyroll fold domain-containing protein [Flavobacterium cheongpyeongense]PXY39212.1 hypothetical protein DMB65_18850 [Flavobacterium cheongpyeongense]
MKHIIKNKIKAVIVLFSIVLIASCSDQEKDFEGKPLVTYPDFTITGISPNEGFPETNVVISGKNFGTLKEAVKVFFGGIPATSVVSCEDSQIVVTVPKKAVSGKVTLQIWTHSHDVESVFTVIPPPVIESVSADAGSPDDVITITGTGFGSDLSKLGISFNGTSGIVNSVESGTTITATVPSGFTSGKITLTVNGYPVVGPNFAYLVAVPNATYQLDFEDNLNATFGGTAATYTQGLGSPISYVTGVSGKAVSLAGYANAAGGTNSNIFNQILALPVNVAQHNELTVSCWVNWPVKTEWTPIFEFGASRGNRLCLLGKAAGWWNGAGDNLVGRTIFENVTGFAGYNETNVITNSQIPVEGWHHVAMTTSKANKQCKIYMDGLLVKTGTLPAAYDLTLYNQNRAYIGASTYGTPNEPAFGGKIDKFQIFNSVLSDNQIYTIYYKK